MKKFTALFLALVLCMSLCVSASAAYSFSAEHWISDETVTITFEQATATETTIPWYDEMRDIVLVTLEPSCPIPDTLSSVSPQYPTDTPNAYMTGGMQWYGDVRTAQELFDHFKDAYMGIPKYIDVYTGNSEGRAVLLTLGESGPSFSDVAPDAWYAQSVSWAVNAGITNGTSETTFSPDTTCTKAHILTFAWRATDGIEYPLESPYTDLTDSSAYYYSAAMWASRYQYDPTDGGEGSAFNANAAYTRANTVELLWNIAGKPTPSKSVNFTDVAADASYAQAVAWAVEQGITNGTSETTFSPDATCTRGQIVTFLYRAFA